MSQLKVTNLHIDSILDFNKLEIDKNLINIRPIPKKNYGMAFDTGLNDVLIYINDLCANVLSGLIVEWLMTQYQEKKLTSSFKINGRTLMQEELENKKLLTQILEQELKNVQLKKQIKKEQEND